jgi:hyperosmotically inducible periplasmic protein
MKASCLRVPSVLMILAGVALAASVATPAMAQSDTDYIQQEVLHQLRMLPYYSVFDVINFQVQGTHVTLSGWVLNPANRSDAEAAVKHVKGVTDVTNNLKDESMAPSDEAIRHAEYRAIYGEPQLQKYGFYAVQGIHIVVNMGHVELDGIVDSASDKNVANIRANSVPGVFSVTNNLQVQGPR